jgi:hypothetical protein
MIHYMTGKEGNLMTTTKTGCSIKSEDVKRGDCFVFWTGKHKVDCVDCIDKINKVLKLQGKS